MDYFSKCITPFCYYSSTFLKYANYKCTANPVGINTCEKMSSTIAVFLNLLGPKEYIGDSFRSSSPSLPADSGANRMKIKKHGGWKFTTVAEDYIEQSITHKKAIAERLHNS